ncbi:epithelial sodium channel subunit alpha-like [Tachypleus tridentatus]|uniref:epithelial sodium channel subunit alpha-like n=1 Tax=Tachypleus tridentatus TaxID=6853 RepID=UPI003FCF3FB5
MRKGTVYKIEVLRRQGTIFASQYELEKFGFMFKDMIKFCRLGVESTCSFQKYYHPVNGLCYILNSRWNESNYVQKILPVEKENETFIDDSSSFVFIIKFDSRNYLRAPGAIITFHHPEEAADFLPHYFIGPGELHEFRLFQSIYHHLPAPYDTSCTDYNKFGTTKARKLRITENGCYAECISNVSLKMCDCVFLSFDYIQRKPDPYARYTEHPNCPQSWTFEDPFPLSCVAGSARGIKRKFSLDLIDCFSNCTVPCRKILYSVKLRKNSLSARHQRQFPEDLKSENRSSLAVVRVKMENRNQKVHITHPKHQWFHSVNQVENIVLIWAVLTVLLNVLERKVIQLQNKTPKSVVEPMVEPEDF